jgi:ABC-type nitrate/sulfonate/bicarbonate transport system ATPase subunit
MADPSSGSERTYLEVRAVSKSFVGRPEARAVLDTVSTVIGRGEFISVIGPSGCGKSTLFDVIAGLETPDRGTVWIDGQDVTGRQGLCAYMPQKDLLFPWRTTLDNTVLGLDIQGVPRREGRARAQELFEQFGLSGYEQARPAELSGGMRQRAALLRTVVQRRPVLLLDEPFGALDSLTRTDLQTWLQGIWQQHGWTLLMITHDIREALYLSERVIVLSARPAAVRREVVVDLPRPRTVDMLTAPAYIAAERELIALLHNPVRTARG